jgi:hypothetical protein
VESKLTDMKGEPDRSWDKSRRTSHNGIVWLMPLAGTFLILPSSTPFFFAAHGRNNQLVFRAHFDKPETMFGRKCTAFLFMDSNYAETF